MNLSPSSRMPARTPRTLAVPALLLAALLGAAGCGGHQDGRSAAPGSGGAPAASTPAGARITVTPAAGAAPVDPGTAVRVAAGGGTLAEVTVTPQGHASDGVTPVAVTGVLDPARHTWTSDRTMTPGTSYTVRATARDAAGRRTSTARTFRTAAAAKVNGVSVTPLNHAVAGVGLPVSLAFDTPVGAAGRAAVEKALTVTTRPAVHGSWGWLTDPLTGVQRVDWRPDAYWKPGTQVVLTARLSGIDTGGHRYLRRDIHDTFTIGTARISYADLRAHTLRVTENGRTLRTLPISAGRAEYPTWNGTMVVLAKQSTVRMTSASVNIATSSDSSDFYDEDVKYAVRLTTSGTFVHAAPWNDSLMGRANGSHGCIGRSTADARWFFARATPGDVVVATGSTRATVDKGNGYGDWNLSAARWRALSALS